MTATTDPVAQFAALLSEEDADGRKSLMARANMMAMANAPEEAFEVIHFEDLSAAARGDVDPPGMLVPGVIVEGQVNWLAGHPAHGKTTIAMHAALTAVRDGRPVVWLDWEGGKLPTVRRLLALGARAEDFERFHYAHAPRLTSDRTGLDAILGALEEWPRALIVFDSASKALSAAGLDENSPTEATKWTTEIIMPLREAGTVIVIDHVTKGATRTTPYARGAGSKLADTEVFWYVEAQEKFSRERSGVILLTKHKDREGVLPERLRFKVGDGKGGLPVERIDADSEEGGEGRESPRTRVMAAVREKLRSHDGEALTGRQVEQMVSGRRAAVADALRDLAADPSEPFTASPGPRTSVLYRHDASAPTALPAT